MAAVEPGEREGIGGTVQTGQAEADTEGGGAGAESKEGGSVNIDEMPAGREMDAMIAEKLDFEPRISWEVFNEDETATAFSADRKSEVERFLSEHLERYPNSWLKDYHVGSWKHYRPYSTNMAAAWEVVEKMNDCLHLRQYGKQGMWEAGFCGYNKECHAKTAPLAICRAALKAVSQ